MEKIKINFDILLPAFNAENTIHKTLESISHQTIAPVKVIIIINGCSDKTETIVNNFIKNSILKIHKIVLKKNIGLVGALNRGLEHCSSKWIARIDADDYWLDKHLSNLSEGIYLNKSDLGLIGGSSIIKQNDKFITTTQPLNHYQIIKFLQRDNPFVHSAVAFRLEAITNVGGYREAFIFEDYDLWIRILKKYKGIIVNSDMCVHIRSNSSMTSKYSLSSALAERLKLQKMALSAFGIRSPISLLSIGLTASRLFYNQCILFFRR
ncbi:glycosyltransferase [Gammaproteobacteria bacterium]|nr:glycosyltransferase [Gammaproteobacteria bacterium]